MKLFEIIKNKRVAIVGPSSSLENKNMGSLIDTYDIVIKINNFSNLPSSDYGNKIDILFCSFNKYIPFISNKTDSIKLIVASTSVF